MKAIFVAALNNPSGSGHQRLWALNECGVTTITFNKDTYKKKINRNIGRLLNLVKRSDLLFDSVAMQADLLKLAESHQPNAIWVEWPREFDADMLKKIKQIKSKPLLISFQDDNPWGQRVGDQWMWRKYFKVIPEFDYHIIKRESDKVNIQNLGGKDCYKWNHGMFSPLFYPSITPIEIKYPVSFVGTCMDGRDKLVEFLLNNGIPIHVFGTRWRERSSLPTRFPHNFHEAVVGNDYAEVIKQSQICLGLVSYSNVDEWTMRTYEVPGCAKTLLAQRTETHEKLFDDGETGILFTSFEECLEKLKIYLPDKEKCSIIGKKSYYRFTKTNQKIELNMKQLIEYIEQNHNLSN